MYNVYRDLLTRVVTMANQFLINQDMLERIASNKGIDAEMALRDKLKAYAIDTRTTTLITLFVIHMYL